MPWGPGPGGQGAGDGEPRPGAAGPGGARGAGAQGPRPRRRPTKGRGRGPRKPGRPRALKTALRLKSLQSNRHLKKLFAEFFCLALNAAQSALGLAEIAASGPSATSRPDSCKGAPTHRLCCADPKGGKLGLGPGPRGGTWAPAPRAPARRAPGPAPRPPGLGPRAPGRRAPGLGPLGPRVSSPGPRAAGPGRAPGPRGPGPGAGARGPRARRTPCFCFRFFRVSWQERLFTSQGVTGLRVQ